MNDHHLRLGSSGQREYLLVVLARTSLQGVQPTHFLANQRIFDQHRQATLAV